MYLVIRKKEIKSILFILTLERSKLLLTWIKHHGSTVRLFSDKKNFTVDIAYNRRNDRFLASSSSEVPFVMKLIKSHRPRKYSIALQASFEAHSMFICFGLLI